MEITLPASSGPSRSQRNSKLKIWDVDTPVLALLLDGGMFLSKSLLFSSLSFSIHTMQSITFTACDLGLLQGLPYRRWDLTL